MGTHVPQPKVLVADRDEDLCRALCRFLTRVGWKHQAIGPGEGLNAVLAKQSFDLIIADASLLGGPSLNELDNLRKRNPALAVIVLTAENLVVDPDSDAATVEVLAKPVDLEKLSSSIHRAMQLAAKTVESSHALGFFDYEQSAYTFTSGEFAKLKFPFVLAERLERAGLLDPRTKLRLDLVFQEAVANALEHGNLELQSELKEEVDATGLDRFTIEKARRLAIPQFRDRKIWITMRYSPGILELRIRDEGKGYIPKERPKTLTPEESILSSGRGMALIYQVMDEVTHHEQGREIFMLKKLPPASDRS